MYVDTVTAGRWMELQQQAENEENWIKLLIKTNQLWSRVFYCYDDTFMF